MELSCAFVSVEVLLPYMLICSEIQVPQIPNHYIGTPKGGMTVYYIPGYTPNQKVTAFPKARSQILPIPMDSD